MKSCRAGNINNLAQVAGKNPNSYNASLRAWPKTNPLSCLAFCSGDDGGTAARQPNGVPKDRYSAAFGESSRAAG